MGITQSEWRTAGKESLVCDINDPNSYPTLRLEVIGFEHLKDFELPPNWNHIIKNEKGVGKTNEER